jgi:hypothetical protein
VPQGEALHVVAFEPRMQHRSSTAQSSGPSHLMVV